MSGRTTESDKVDRGLNHCGSNNPGPRPPSHPPPHPAPPFFFGGGGELTFNSVAKDYSLISNNQNVYPDVNFYTTGQQ